MFEKAKLKSNEILKTFSISSAPIPVESIAESLGIKISMSEQANPYENAVAERVNGILKQEFMLDKTFPDIKTAWKAVKEAIKTYNEKRPHMSLGYKTPEQIYKVNNELSTY